MSETSSVVRVELSRVAPDESQPRKNFPPERQHDLQESIRKHGLMTPLIVTKQKDGTYVLVDGERRYRALRELHVKQVPVIVMEEMNPSERLIKQFHIQEQHEGWTATEKALAMKKLADALGLSMEEMGRQLGVPHGMVNNYVAFAGLLERNTYQKEELPLKFASQVNRIKTAARKAYDKEKKDFEVSDERQIEKAVIGRMKEGELKQNRDFQRVVDSFAQDPKTVGAFLKHGGVNEMYRKSNAEAYTNFRRLNYIASFVSNYVHKADETDFRKLYENAPAARAQLRKAAEDLTTFVRQIS